MTRLSATVLKVLGHSALSANASTSPFGPDLMYIIGGKASRIVIDAGEGRPEDLTLLLDAMKKNGIKEITDLLITHYHADFNEGVDRLRLLLGSHLRIWRLPWPKGTVEAAAGITASSVEAAKVRSRDLARRWSSVKDVPTLGVHKLDKDGEIMTASGDAKLMATLNGSQWMVRVYDGRRRWLVAQFEGNLKLTESDRDDELSAPEVEPTASHEMAIQTDDAGDLTSWSEASVQTDAATPCVINHAGTQTSPLEPPRALKAAATTSSQTDHILPVAASQQNATSQTDHILPVAASQQNATTSVSLRTTWSATVCKFVWSSLLRLALAFAILAIGRFIVATTPATLTVVTEVLNATCLALSCMLSTLYLWLFVAAERVAFACSEGLRKTKTCSDGLRRTMETSFDRFFPQPVVSPPPSTAFDWLLWQDMPLVAQDTLTRSKAMLHGSVESLRLCGSRTANFAVDGLLTAPRLLSRAQAGLARPESLDRILALLSTLGLCLLVLALLSSCCARRQDRDGGQTTGRGGMVTPPTSPPGSRAASPVRMRDHVNTHDRRGDNGWYMQLRDGKWFHA